MKESRLIKPLLNQAYKTVTHGEGIYLFDEDGNRYIDGCSGAVTASIGHSVPEIAEAMEMQAAKISFAYRSQFTSEPAERLAAKLQEMAPAEGDYWSFFVNSGSEATETAMKIAIQHYQERGLTGKNLVISRRMSYHGITMGALSMSGHTLRRKKFEPLLQELPVVAPAYCYRCPFGKSYPGCGLACADDLEAAIERIGASNIAAFIAEPIVGAAGGALVPPDGYFKQIKAICERHDILFIADEVMTGIARTGAMFAMERYGVQPDLIALGKGMSAGYTPIAATLVSARVMEPILQGSGSIMAGHTYSANPQSAAVSLAVLDYIERHDLDEAARTNGAYLLAQLRQLAATSDIIGDVRGEGMLIAVEFVADRASKQPFPAELGVTSRVIEHAFRKGLLVYPASGALDGAGDAIILAPPLTIEPEQIDELVRIAHEAIQDVRAALTEVS